VSGVSLSALERSVVMTAVGAHAVVASKATNAMRKGNVFVCDPVLASSVVLMAAVAHAGLVL